MDLLTLSVTRVRTRRAANCPDHALAQPAQESSALRAEPAETELSFDSLEAALTDGFEVIDVRESQELARFGTPCSSARHLPIAQLLHGRPDISTGNRYLLVCASGKRSLGAAQELRSRGYAEVFSLRGGIATLTRNGTATV